MDAAIIYRGHKQYRNRNTLYIKIKKALKQLESDKKVTKEQHNVLIEMQQFDNFGRTIMSKRHSYTDEHTNNPHVFTDRLIIVIKKPLLRVVREVFAMIRVVYPNYLGGGIQILATGIGDIHGYDNYRSMCVRSNDYHNSTDFITIDGYHPYHRRLKVKFGNHLMQRVYKYLNDIDGVYDVVETNKSQKVGKYFIIVDKNKRRGAELVIHEIMQALVHQIQDIADPDAEMKLNQFPSLRSRLSQGGYTSEAAVLD